MSLFGMVRNWFWAPKLIEEVEKVEEDLPAIEGYGTKEWYKNGELHRVGGPARICKDGTKEWFQNGIHHRLDGPAIESLSGYKAWIVYGKYHRTDGPAIECGELKEWWVNGVRHR